MIRLSSEEEKDFSRLSEAVISHPDYDILKTLKAHGRLTVYDHSLDVARYSFRLNRRLHLKIDEEALVWGALLHDFYLYDWHKARINVPLFKMHGYTHPSTAAENAAERFDISAKIDNIIRSHMWPLTLRTLPQSREAWLVCLSDKIVATRETFTR